MVDVMGICGPLGFHVDNCLFGIVVLINGLCPRGILIWVFDAVLRYRGVPLDCVALQHSVGFVVPGVQLILVEPPSNGCAKDYEYMGKTGGSHKLLFIM